MRTYTEQELKDSYRGRVKDDAKELGSGYCGSCSYEIHVAQMLNPDSWVHSCVESWLSGLKPKKQTHIQLGTKIDDLNDDLALRGAIIETKDKRIAELESAWNSMRAEILHGVEFLDNDQKNAVLGIIDYNYPDIVYVMEKIDEPKRGEECDGI